MVVAVKLPDATYAGVLQAAQRAEWAVEDLIGGDRRLDFSRPFLPEALAGIAGLEFLSREEALALNQIRAHGYLCLFGLAEEFILPFVLDHARVRLHGASSETRALLQFASEEAKHIDLFRRFRDEFEAGFGVWCEATGPAREIAEKVMAHHPLAIALMVLHIEWMTQRHYLESVRDDSVLDPRFADLLKHHWMEEVQHAKLDAMIIASLAERCSAAEIDAAIGEYIAICAMLDRRLRQQATFDRQSLSRKTGRAFTPREVEALEIAQQQSLRWTFLGSGMTHPNVVSTVERLSPGAAPRIQIAASDYCR